MNKYSNDEQLLLAAEDGDFEEVKKLLKKGANPDAIIKTRLLDINALDFAIKFGHFDIALLFLENYSFSKRNLNRSLSRACAKGSKKIVSLLLEKGAEVNFQNSLGRTALMSSLSAKNTSAAVAIAKKLIENGAETSLKDGEGETVTDMLEDEFYKNTEKRHKFAQLLDISKSAN